MARATVFTLILLAALTEWPLAQERVEADRIPDVVFVATPMEVVTGMLELAGVADTDVVYDLGSGDGRIVIAAARHYGARAVGVEIDPSLVAESRKNADTAGVLDRVEFRRADVFKTDLREATVVTLYLGRALNERLRPIFFRDLRPGSRVVSQAFDMGDWRPDSIVTIGGRNFADTPVHVWVIPAGMAGRWELSVTRAGASAERMRLELSQKYQALDGSAAVGGRRVAIENVRLRGDSIAFSIGERRFTGRVSDGRAEGAVISAGNAPVRWRAVRAGRP